MNNRQTDSTRKYLALGAVILVLFVTLVILKVSRGGNEEAAHKSGERSASFEADAGNPALLNGGQDITRKKDAENLAISGEEGSKSPQTDDQGAAIKSGDGRIVLLEEEEEKLLEGGDGTLAAGQTKGTESGSSAGDAAPTTITISAVGDCTLGMDETFDYDTSLNAAFYDRGDPSWFLANCRTYFADDDLTIVNFEGVLSERGERQDKTYAFRGDPEFVRILTEGSVEAANLANNHSFDYGEEAYEDTKQILLDAGITSFGYDRSAVVTVRGIKVGLTGSLALYDEYDTKDKMTEQIRWCKEQGAELIISSIHWGEEGEYYQDDLQEYLGRAAVDAGADLVIGHHPHRLQPYEVYQGKVILYSLGNFCFGGNTAPSDMDTAVFRQTFTFENDGSGGLKLKEDPEYEIIPFSISSADGYNNYQPKELSGEAAERALNKISRI